MPFFFGHEAYGILATQPGTEPAAPALEGEVLTTGPQGKPWRVPLKILCDQGFSFNSFTAQFYWILTIIWY